MEIDRSKQVLIILSALPLVFGTVLASAVKGSAVIGDIVRQSRMYTPLELLTQAIVSTSLGILVVLALFWVMNKRGRGTRKFVVAFVVSPVLYFVSLFIGESFLLILLKGTTDVLYGIISLVSIAVSMVSIVLIVIDAIPPGVRNVFVAFYGSVFGIFLGITMVTSTIFVMVLSLIAEDFLLTRFSPAANETVVLDRIGKDPFDYTRIQTSSVVIGVGDYVAYSLISAHTFVFFPLYVWLMSTVLTVVGIFVNVVFLARENKVLPAIPLPATMAILPWVVHIGMLLTVV